MQLNYKKRIVSNVDSLVSQRLKARRLMLGISLKEISAATEVSITQIQKYEKALDRISSGKLYDIAKFLKTPIAYFFDPCDYDLSPFNKKDLEFIKIFNEIKKQQLKKQVIELVQAINAND